MYASILSLRTPNLNRVGIRNPIKLLQDAKLTQVRPPGGVVRGGACDLFSHRNGFEER